MTARLVVALLVASGVTLIGESEFDHVVKAIETHYGTKRTSIPFMGLANVFLKVAHPAGTSEFKLAVFDDLKSNVDAREDRELDRFMRNLSSSRLHPLIAVHSRRDGESIYIYAGDEGRNTRMLIATFQRDQATVVQVRVDIDSLLKWLNSPEEASEFFSRGDSSRDER